MPAQTKTGPDRFAGQTRPVFTGLVNLPHRRRRLAARRLARRRLSER